MTNPHDTIEAPSLAQAWAYLRRDREDLAPDDLVERLFAYWSRPVKEADEGLRTGQRWGTRQRFPLKFGTHFLGYIAGILTDACHQSGQCGVAGLQVVEAVADRYQQAVQRAARAAEEEPRRRQAAPRYDETAWPPLFEVSEIALALDPIDWSDPVVHLPYLAAMEVVTRASYGQFSPDHQTSWALIFLMTLALVEGRIERPTPSFLWLPMEPGLITFIDEVSAEVWGLIWRTHFSGVEVDPDFGVDISLEALSRIFQGNRYDGTLNMARIESREVLRAFIPWWVEAQGDPAVIERLIELLDESRGERKATAPKTKRRGASRQDLDNASEWVHEEIRALRETDVVPAPFLNRALSGFRLALTDASDPGRRKSRAEGLHYRSHTAAMARDFGEAVETVAGPDGGAEFAQQVLNNLKAAIPVREGRLPERDVGSRVRRRLPRR